MNNILGESPYGTNGKIVRGQPDAVKTKVIPLPTNICKDYSTMTLCTNVMFVNTLALLIMVSRKIHFGTIHELTSMKIPVLETAINNIVKSYADRAFMIKLILVDL